MPCHDAMSAKFSCHVTNFLKTWRNGISTRNNDDRKYPLLQIIVAIIVVVVMILSCFHATPAH
jgi:hypothetical protein